MEIEQREALWRRHLEEQTAQYEFYDRNLSDKVSRGGNTYDASAFGETTPGVGERKEKKRDKEKKEKKDKKERKERKADAGDVAPRGVTILGGGGATPSPAAAAADVGDEEATSAIDAAAAKRLAEAAALAAAEAAELAPVAVESKPAPSVPSEPTKVSWAGELTWPNLVLTVRGLLLRNSRIPAEELPELWRKDLGYELSFPIFGMEDLQALCKQLQPAALTIVDRRRNVLMASSEAALAREQQEWEDLASRGRTGTATEWIQAALDRDLKAVRQSLKERRSAQQVAAAQSEKIRQEYQALQSNSKGQKSAQLRSTKMDLDKQEQRVNKFRLAAEELEKQERGLLASISEEQKRAHQAATVPASAAGASAVGASGYPAVTGSATAATPPVAPAPAKADASKPEAGGRTELSVEDAREVEEDFM